MENVTVILGPGQPTARCVEPEGRTETRLKGKNLIHLLFVPKISGKHDVVFAGDVGNLESALLHELLDALGGVLVFNLRLELEFGIELADELLVNIASLGNLGAVSARPVDEDGGSGSDGGRPGRTRGASERGGAKAGHHAGA